MRRSPKLGAARGTGLAQAPRRPEPALAASNSRATPASNSASPKSGQSDRRKTNSA